MKKAIALLLAAMMIIGMFAACSQNDAKEPEESESEAVSQPSDQSSEPQTDDDENYETGDASLDNPRNADGIGEAELLVVSFGTSFNDNRRLTIGAIEAAEEAAFPEYSVRRAFTAQIIIDHVFRRDGEVIDNFGQAIQRAIDNGVKTLVVQPTHLMNGLEYNDVIDELSQYADAFDKVVVGEPLLTSEEDFDVVMNAIVNATKEYDDGKTAICFMGHGTEAESNQIYSKMQGKLTDAGYSNYYVGTVEASPSVEEVLALVKTGSYERVVLMPLMIVAGDHANNDMAGDEEGSWKTTFEAEGYEVVTLLSGLGEIDEIQQLLVKHTKAAIDSIAG